jgi:undecaprenyl-diphosphatase
VVDLAALDRAVSLRLVDRRTTTTGHLLARANGLPTWAAFAVGLATRGERGRRAARRAVASAACGSVLADLVLKPLVARRRPRGATRTTRSFPSGHATTGAAFAAAVALEWPAAGLLAGLASTTIALGRVRDGQHHVADVVAGTALGAAVAVAVHRRGTGPAGVEPKGHPPRREPTEPWPSP